jgi:hypothetical protein
MLTPGVPDQEKPPRFRLVRLVRGYLVLICGIAVHILIGLSPIWREDDETNEHE